MRFQRSEKLAKDYSDAISNVFGADNYIEDKTKEMAERNTKKFGCYVLEVGHKEIIHEIKMLGLAIEECVNIAVQDSQDNGKFPNSNA